MDLLLNIANADERFGRERLLSLPDEPSENFILLGTTQALQS